MKRLLVVELKRLLARRLFRLVVVVGLLAVLVVDGIIAARSSTDVAAAKAAAVRNEQQSYDACLSFAAAGNGGPTKADCDSQRPEAQMRQCQADNPTHPDRNCASILNEYYQDPRFHFADHAKDLLTSAAYILMMVGLLLGASAVGAEWQSGTFAALLTWEPRRQRVLAAKVVAPVLLMTLVATVLGGLLLAGADIAAATRGTTAGTTGQVVHELFSMSGRVLGLIALVTLLGAALAALTRHTVAVVAVVGGYLVAGELVGAIVSTWWRHHGLAAQLFAFIRGEFHYSTQGRIFGSRFDEVEHVLHASWAAVIVTIVVGAALAIAATALSRRDVA
jgi:ABC-2 type transport system permease protein